MFLRTSSAACVMLVSACGPVHREEDEASIPCALNGAAAFAETCKALGALNGVVWTVTVRHPDGGFRRFNVTDDRQVSAADGAEAASGRQLPDGQLEVSVGVNRYRLPAAMK